MYIAIIICITALVSLVLVLKSIERIFTKVYTPPPLQELPDLAPLKNELADIKTKLSSMQIAAGFKRM